MKRLLVLNYEFPPLGGGASPVSYELAKRLSETGDYDIDVVTMHYKGLPRYEEINSNLRVHRVRSWRSKKELSHPWEQLTYLVSGYRKCRQLLTKEKFDLCHTHFIIPTGILARRLKKEFGLHYIITSHGSDVLGYNKRFKYLYPLLVGHWKAVLNDARTIISPSNFLKTEILKVYPTFDEQKIIVIPNGIDTTKFTPQPKKNYIFSSGRLMPMKGFQYLIQAVSAEDLGWEVHIAGDGPMRHELEEMAKQSKTKIIFHGWLDNNDTEYKDLLEQAAIYVLASERENASIALLEAMCAECAVVTTNVSGCPETVGEAGLLVHPADCKSLQAALDSLVKDLERVGTLQEAAAARVRSVYGWDEVLKKYRHFV